MMLEKVLLMLSYLTLSGEKARVRPALLDLYVICKLHFEHRLDELEFHLLLKENLTLQTNWVKLSIQLKSPKKTISKQKLKDLEEEFIL